MSDKTAQFARQLARQVQISAVNLNKEAAPSWFPNFSDVLSREPKQQTLTNSPSTDLDKILNQTRVSAQQEAERAREYGVQKAQRDAQDTFRQAMISGLGGAEPEQPLSGLEMAGIAGLGAIPAAGAYVYGRSAQRAKDILAGVPAVAPTNTNQFMAALRKHWGKLPVPARYALGGAGAYALKKLYDSW